MAVTVAGARGRNQRRQKQIIAVGGVLLLGILFIQVPRMMKMMNPSTGSSSTASTAPAPTTPVPGAASVPAVPGATPAAPAATEGKLTSFHRFRTKDLFASQIKSAAATAPATGSAPTAPAPTAPSAGPTTGTRVVPKAKTAWTQAVEGPDQAVITLNGTEYDVHENDTFPSADPAFRVVAVNATTAKIAIVGGQLKDGGATVTLEKGKPLTLMNTADGKRYVLRLVSTST